jgi:hypothetical protein
MPTKTRLGCLHMHHSNIAYVDGIVDAERVEALHFVDPGLMRRITSEPGFTADEAREQVRRQLAWMASCGLDAILITCTNYIAMLPDEPLDLAMPVIKIDEPFFAHLLDQPVPHLLVFTNPATVPGTMSRFRQFAARANRDAEIDVEVIEGTFELLMAGKTAEYAEAVAARLREIAGSGRHRSLSVGQLSLADAALAVSRETGQEIGNPLTSLREHLDRCLSKTHADG